MTMPTRIMPNVDEEPLSLQYGIRRKKPMTPFEFDAHLRRAKAIT